MIDQATLEQLATLARIAISDEEKARLLKDLEAILGYVSELDSVVLSEKQTMLGHALVTNVTRPDEAKAEDSESREALLAEAPARSGDYVKVKPVLAGK